MPRVTIWIKKDDYEKWQAIADKPEWLHEHLNLYDSNPRISTGVALEDIKKGQYGSMYLQPNVIDEPTVTEPEETA